MLTQKIRKLLRSKPRWRPWGHFQHHSVRHFYGHQTTTDTTTAQQFNDATNLSKTQESKTSWNLRRLASPKRDHSHRHTSTDNSMNAPNRIWLIYGPSLQYTFEFGRRKSNSINMCRLNATVSDTTTITRRIRAKKQVFSLKRQIIVENTLPTATV